MKNRNQPYELALYAKSINCFEVLSLEKELALSRRYLAGDMKAGEAIINGNLRLALKISRTYFHRGHYPLEIVQEANLGLVRALTMFNPDRGIKFFSYAVWWVHAYIRNYLFKNSRGMLGYSSFLISLDTALPDRDNEDECFKDHLSDDSPNQEERYFSVQRTVLISKILSAEDGPLNTREKYILKRRFFEEPRPTLSQLGKKMKISKERIRQIENNSLTKIKNHIQLHHPMIGQDFMEAFNSNKCGEEIFEELRAAG